MVNNTIIGITYSCLTTGFVNANASVINTIKNVDYQWLELSPTIGLSRDQVEAQIAAAVEGDILFGQLCIAFSD